MFLGEFIHTLDEKGRLTIQARFRDLLTDGAVVTRGFDRHLILYPADTFERVSRKAGSLSPTDPQNRALFRLLFSGAAEAAPDKASRILIPAFLRNYAGLELSTEVTVIGSGEYAEIWSPGGWQEQLAQLNDPALNAQRFAALDLAFTS